MPTNAQRKSTWLMALAAVAAVLMAVDAAVRDVQGEPFVLPALAAVGFGASGVAHFFRARRSTAD